MGNVRLENSTKCDMLFYVNGEEILIEQEGWRLEKRKKSNT